MTLHACIMCNTGHALCGIQGLSKLGLPGLHDKCLSYRDSPLFIVCRLTGCFTHDLPASLFLSEFVTDKNK